MEDILGEIAQLAQDPNEAGDGDTVKHSLGIFSISLFVELRLTQAVLVPHLEPHQRHLCSLWL